MTEDEFVEKFVRTGTPVILEGCSGYKWMEKHDFSLKNIVKVSCLLLFLNSIVIWNVFHFRPIMTTQQNLQIMSH